MFLDWDLIAWHECKRRIEIIKENLTIKKILIYQSPGMDGYHIMIEFFIEPGVMRLFELRRNWKDDPFKLAKDMAAPRAIYRNVMFVYKTNVIHNNLHANREVLMVIYERNPDGSWLQLPKSQLVI